jgi:hypothetical protein
MRYVGPVVFLALATAGWAAERETVPGPSSASEPAPVDAVEAAKRDLQEIKARRNGLETPRADLPRFDTPEMHAGAPSQPQASSRLSPAEAAALKKKSANWLVDAMAKKPERPGDAKPDADKSRAEADDTLDKRDQPATKELKREEERDRPDKANSRFSKDLVVNPLTTFMAGWMTPQDYKLLQPGLTSETSTGFAGSRDGSFAPVVGNAGGDVLFPTAASTAIDRANAAPRPNPFLQDFNAPSPLSAAAPVTPSLPASSPQSPKAVELPPPPAPLQPKSTLPPFVKPLDDAKYYKPLKRF